MRRDFVCSMLHAPHTSFDETKDIVANSECGELVSSAVRPVAATWHYFTRWAVDVLLLPHNMLIATQLSTATEQARQDLVSVTVCVFVYVLHGIISVL